MNEQVKIDVIGRTPSPASIVGAAALGLAIGLGVVIAMSDVRTVISRRFGQPAVVPASNAPSITVEPQKPNSVTTPSAAPALASAVAAPSAPSSPSGVLVQPGRIAYLRCDGIPPTPGPFPCPRDRALEDRVAELLQTLPSCKEPPPVAQDADLRMEFHGARGRAYVKHDDRLLTERTLECLKPALRELTTTVAAERLVVSWRFSVVEKK